MSDKRLRINLQLPMSSPAAKELANLDKFERGVIIRQILDKHFRDATGPQKLHALGERQNGIQETEPASPLRNLFSYFD